MEVLTRLPWLQAARPVPRATFVLSVQQLILCALQEQWQRQDLRYAHLAERATTLTRAAQSACRAQPMDGGRIPLASPNTNVPCFKTHFFR